MASVLSSGTTTEELPPGFRFFPTDEELIVHYLMNEASKCIIGLNNVDQVQECYFFSNKDGKYPTTGMRTNRATPCGYWKATGKDKEIFRGLKRTLVFYSDERQTGVDVSDDAMRDSALYNHGFNIGTPKVEDSVHCSVGAPQPLVSVCDAAFYEFAPTCQYLRSLLDLPFNYGDLKPSNVLLDEETDNQLSDFGLPSRLLHADDYTQIPRGSAVPTHNGSLDANFLGKPSAKHGIGIKTGFHMTHRRTYLSAHHHPLMKMGLSSFKRLADIITRFGTAEAGWTHSTPHSGPVSEYIIKLFGIRNEFTVNESQQHSDPDSRRAENTKMAATSASWIIATAAPHHATGDRNLLSGFTMEHDDLFVHAVNRVPMKVLGRGAVVTDELIIPDVWYVPGLTQNLVSVSQLSELDHSIGFGRGECCIRSTPDAKIVGKGHLQKDGQYVLDYLKVPLPYEELQAGLP